MRAVESLQKEVWACDDRDITPLTIFAATRQLGGILIGAFDGLSLLGFAFSFVGRVPGQDALTIEIPADINTVQREHSNLAARWREATRWAFNEAMSSGYVVEDFYGSSRNNLAVGVYLLRFGKS